MLATLGLLTIVGGVIRIAAAGWGSAEVIGLFGAAAVLLAAFVAVESRALERRCCPCGCSASAASACRRSRWPLNGGAFLGMFFLTALTCRQVQGDTALEAGVRIRPDGRSERSWAAAAGAQLVTRIGTRAVTSPARRSASPAWACSRARVGAHASYAADLLPGFVVYGLGIPFIGVTNQISGGRRGAARLDAGAVSGTS